MERNSRIITAAEVVKASGCIRIQRYHVTMLAWAGIFICWWQWWQKKLAVPRVRTFDDSDPDFNGLSCLLFWQTSLSWKNPKHKWIPISYFLAEGSNFHSNVSYPALILNAGRADPNFEYGEEARDWQHCKKETAPNILSFWLLFNMGNGESSQRRRNSDASRNELVWTLL